MSTPRPAYFDERTTAKLLGLPVATLARWREWNPALVPPHTEDAMGDTAYPRAAVLRWLASLPKVHGVPQFPAMHGHAYSAPSSQAMH